MAKSQFRMQQRYSSESEADRAWVAKNGIWIVLLVLALLFLIFGFKPTPPFFRY